MANEEPSDFNIFGPGLSSFSGIIDHFRAFFELAAPLSEVNSGGIGLFTIPLYKDKNSTLLPAFTDSRLLRQPFAAKAPLEFLKLFFHSQNADFFSFNSSARVSGDARHTALAGNLSANAVVADARHTALAGNLSANAVVADAGPEVRLNRQQLSLIIGALETLACRGPLAPSATETGKGPAPARHTALAGNLSANAVVADARHTALAGNLSANAVVADEDPAKAAQAALVQARAHSAHYLASLAPAGLEADFIKASAFAELDLYQDAYDLLKGDKSPRALCLLAGIHRRTGNQRNARELLSSIPRNAGQDRKKNLETAWLELEEGKTIEAQRMFGTLAAGSDDRQEALFGLAMAAAGAVSKTENSAGLNEAAAAFEAALENPSKMSARIFFYAGNFFLRSGRAARAEVCYRESARMSPSPQVRANLTLALLKGNKLEEAAATAAELALIEPASAGRLINQFPKDKVTGLFKNAFLSLLKARPMPPAAASPSADNARETAGRGKGIEQQIEMTQSKSSGGLTQPPPLPAVSQPLPAVQSGAPEETTVSLEAAAPKIVKTRENAPATTSSAGKLPASAVWRAPDVQLETFKDMMMACAPSQEETKKDSFLSRAFTLASDLEDEFGEKIYFNAEGLTHLERKLRFTFIKAKNNPQEKLDTVRDCSAFLCYVLQERFKGRLIKFQDFDPWGWPMIFERPSKKIASYPIVRVWKLLWHDALPDPGWLMKYLRYLEGELNSAPDSRLQGAAAVRSRVMSHAEKITEAQTEHKRILILASSLVETSHIGTGRTGLVKLEQILRNTFHPHIPPTADGWKLLRCYGHFLAGIMVMDFKASWYNVEGNDGLWSMQTPWKTFIFPIGKVYKAASSGENLAGYYDRLADEKRRYTAQ